MSSRKEERERMRQERLAAQQAASSSEKRRLYIGYAVAGLIVAAIVAGLVVVATGGGNDDGDTQAAGDFPERAHIQPELGAVFPGAEPDGREGTTPPEQQIGVLADAAKAAGCDPQLDLPEEGKEHFSNDEREVDYETNPPTSGDHYAGNEAGSGALADGAYLNTPPMPRVVHAMEHGRVVIHYSPELPEEQQLEIKGVFEEKPGGVIMIPNPEMPFEVAVAAWTQLVGCDTYEGAATLDVVRSFRDTYLNQGPEFVPIAI